MLNRSLYFFKELLTLFALRRSIHPKKYFVSEKYKLIYIPVSKSGNSTVKKIILESEGVYSKSDTPYHVHRSSEFKEYTKRNLKKEWENYFCFTVVRHPVERFISSYNNKFLDKEKITKRGFEFTRYLNGYLKQDMSLEDVFKRINRLPERLMDEHFVSQYYWIYKYHKVNPKIYKLEELNFLIEDLRLLGLNIDNVGTSNKSNFKSEVSEDTINKIKCKYKRDMVIFDYD